MSAVRTLLAVLLLGAGLGLAACEEEGPAEQMGEAADEAAEDAGNAAEEAAGDAKRAVDDATN